MIRARGRAISGALALTAAAAIWILAGAAPAAAYVCDFGINRPTPGSRLDTAAVRVSGPFSTRHGSADRIIEVTFTAGPGAVAPTRTTVPPGETYDVRVGPLALNGAYTARVTATHDGTSPTLNCDDEPGSDRRDTQRTAGVSFEVSVRARPPANVRATFDAGARSATITWDRSSDPDIAGYRITRKVGAAAPTTLDVPPEPRSWTDTRLPAEAVTLTYSVEAARNGPRPGTTSERSVAVAAAPLAIPGPTSPPTSTRGPAGSGGTGRGAGSTAITQPFILGRSVGDAEAPPATALPLPDLAEPGNLEGAAQPLGPYTTIPEEGGSLVLNDDDQAMGAGGRGDGDGTRQLAYVAAGLLTAVVAAQALWLRRQALRPEPASGSRDRSPLEPLEPVTPPASAQPAGRGVSGPVVAAGPTPPDGPSDAGGAPAPPGGDRDVILRPSTDGPPAFVPAARVERPAASRRAEASLAGPPAAGAAVAAASGRGDRRSRRRATRGAGAPVRAVPVASAAPPTLAPPPEVHLVAGRPRRPVASPPEVPLEAVGSPAPERPAPQGTRGKGPVTARRRPPVRSPRPAAPERQLAPGRQAETARPAPAKESRPAPRPGPKRGRPTPSQTRPRSRAVLIVRPRAPGAS